MKPLDDIRKQIDLLDDQLIEVLIKRYDLVQQVKTYKQTHNLPVLDSSREQHILKKLSNKPYHEQLEQIYHLILSLSKDLQH